MSGGISAIESQPTISADMSAHSYYQLLSADMSDLGILPGDDLDFSNGSLSDYNTLITCTGAAFSDTSRYNTIPPQHLFTDLGRAIRRLADTGESYFTDMTSPSCLAAENKLVSSLDPDNVAIPETYSPLIVTDSGDPVAVIKWKGEQLAFGLQDVDEFHVIRGAFSGVPSYIYYRERPASPNAFTIDIAELLRVPDGAKPWHFNPARFSQLFIPKSVRRQLHPQQFTTPQIDIEDVSRMVDDLMPAAEPLPLKGLMRGTPAYPSPPTER